MMIESRPAQRATFEYIFYCDAPATARRALKAAIETLRGYALETTILGSYPYRIHSMFRCWVLGVGSGPNTQHPTPNA